MLLRCFFPLLILDNGNSHFVLANGQKFYLNSRSCSETEKRQSCLVSDKGTNGCLPSVWDIRGFSLLLHWEVLAQTCSNRGFFTSSPY